MSKSKKIKTISGWDWETLVASWRYFEYRHTISSASFPGDIIARFWRSGNYADDVLDTIANQFANIDHRNGERDWDDFKSNEFSKCDYIEWKKLYCFFKAWCDDKWELVRADDGRKTQTHLCFIFDEKLIPMKVYIEHPSFDIYLNPEHIKEVKHGVSRQRKNGGAE